MEEEYEWEEFSDEAIKDLEAFIHAEKQLVKKKHSFFSYYKVTFGLI